MWLNVARMLSVFHKNDKFGASLLLKLAAVSAGFLGAFQQTACFVGCQTGNLDRVFSDARLPKSDVVRYRRLAIIHTIVCWVSLLADANIYLLPMFIMDDKLTQNSSMTPFGVHLFAPELLTPAKVMIVVVFILADFAWFFSHSVNYNTYYTHSKSS